MTNVMTNNYVTIFNAPPGAGKDTAAEWMIDNIELDLLMWQFEFKRPLYDITAAIYQVPLEDFIRMATDRKQKVAPQKCLNGKTPRQALIEVSEKVIKPVYGSDFFGKAAAQKMGNVFAAEGDGNLAMFSDGGFPEEAWPVFGQVGYENSLVVRIFRDGCDYSNDSRRYLTPEDFGNKVKFVDITNNGSIEDLGEMVYSKIKSLIQQ